MIKKIAYFLFPFSLRLLGLVFIGVSSYHIYSCIRYSSNDLAGSLGSSIGFLIIGLILNATYSIMIFNKDKMVVSKTMRILGISMKEEKVNVPIDCEDLFIKLKTKKATGYYDFIIPFNYRLKSGDMYFHCKRGLVRLMNTSDKQALKIAEIIKEVFNIDYKIG